MSVFVAIEIPEKIKNDLIRAQKEFEPFGMIKFVRDFHLTLKFIGEISPLKIEKIKERLRTIGFKEFELYLSRFGVFPNYKRINVIWIGVEPQRKIKKLQEAIENKLIDILPPEKDFKGHITIGRVVSVRDKDKLLDKLHDLKIDGVFKIRNFYLIQSELTSRGPIYTILEKYGL